MAQEGKRCFTSARTRYKFITSISFHPPLRRSSSRSWTLLLDASELIYLAKRNQDAPRVGGARSLSGVRFLPPAKIRSTSDHFSPAFQCSTVAKHGFHVKPCGRVPRAPSHVFQSSSSSHGILRIRPTSCTSSCIYMHIYIPICIRA